MTPDDMTPEELQQWYEDRISALFEPGDGPEEDER